MTKLNWLAQISWLDGLIAASIFLLFSATAHILYHSIPKIITRFTKKSKKDIDQALVMSFRKPLVLILLATGLILALSYLPIPNAGMQILRRFYASLATLAIGWGFYLFSNTVGIFFDQVQNRYDLQFNNIIIPFIIKIAKFLVAVFTIVAILEQWQYHVTGLITGLGIGGLAIAMAAKDTLSNFFGGLVIITDAPFTIGELIQSGTIEGVVEDINFRSTRIRTTDQALVTVPNSTLANQPITNLSRLGKRRIFITTPLDVRTSNLQLQTCLKKIRRLIKTDDALYEEGQMVYLDKISTSSIDLSIQLFTKTIDFGEWTAIKERYNIAVLQILDEENIYLAATSATGQPLPADNRTNIGKAATLKPSEKKSEDDSIEKKPFRQSDSQSDR